MTRDEILARYRHLRAISVEHNRAAQSFLAMPRVMEEARRLGLMVGKTLVLDSEEEFMLAFDLVIYTAKPGRSRPLDRYVKQARFPPGSDEERVLEAMRHARFSIWQVERRHEAAGLILRDIIRQEEAWLVDIGLEQSTDVGRTYAIRLYQPDRFAMTSGVPIPVDGALMEEVLTSTLPSIHGTPEQVVDNPRFAEAVYRTAIASGVMQGVAFRKVE